MSDYWSVYWLYIAASEFAWNARIMFSIIMQESIEKRKSLGEQRKKEIESARDYLIDPSPIHQSLPESAHIVHLLYIYIQANQREIQSVSCVGSSVGNPSYSMYTHTAHICIIDARERGSR